MQCIGPRKCTRVMLQSRPCRKGSQLLRRQRSFAIQGNMKRELETLRNSEPLRERQADRQRKLLNGRVSVVARVTRGTVRRPRVEYPAGVPAEDCSGFQTAG